ncbi:hypothetical protein MKW98_026912 [Papaver atlanticum]|uniref:Phosphatidylinositol transfer protein N-terminal domain-containing protein n=1 Tax=Papaver atlanticum TaxID=357466 RepID=A0AAD4XLZ7_9MAGN|nr:hypothetical protein MKW98_026912 [Papaver atlanticum]
MVVKCNSKVREGMEVIRMPMAHLGGDSFFRIKAHLEEKNGGSSHAVIKGETTLFLEIHRNCFAWIDEWFGIKMEQIRELEVS